MYRITGRNGNYYAIEVGDIDDFRDNEEEHENIIEFVRSGEPVILAEDLTDAAIVLGIDEEDFTVV